MYVACAVLVAGLVAACNQDTPPAATTTVEQVEEEPARFYGQQVTLYGEVDQVYSQRAFELEGMDVWFDDQILVLARSPIVLGAETLTDDDEILVTGTIREFVVADIERELGWDLDPELETQYADQPVLVAAAVSTYQEQARWAEQEYPQGIVVGLVPILVTPDPSRFVGQRIVISNVPVRSKTEQVTWLGYGDRNQILVAPQQPGTLGELEEGELVTVIGTVERMPSPAEARRMWNLPRAMQTQIAGEPLYVKAEQIEEQQESQQQQEGQQQGQ